MSITKQDFQKILTYLRTESIKDSRFSKSGAVDSTTLFTVLQGSAPENRLIAESTLRSWLEKSLDLSKIGVAVSGLNASSLQEALQELASSPRGDSQDVATVNADHVYYYMNRGGMKIEHAKDALDLILQMLYGEVALPCLDGATTNDINNILNQL